MTEPYNGNALIRLVGGVESTSPTKISNETEDLEARIEAEGSFTLPLTPCPLGLEVDIRHHSSEIQRLIGNRRINREDLSEIYLELGPAESNCPPGGQARPT